LPPTPILAFLLAAAALAGFLDAIVGGGGLITVPALMIALPGVPVPTLLGTNKVLATGGATFAAGKFLRSGAMDWREALGPVVCAGAGSIAGSWLTYRVGPGFMRPLMLALMGAMLLFTLLKPDLGKVHAPRFGLSHQRGLAALIGLALGVYDGFFGPGTGSLYIFLFVALLGFDFLRSSALAKAANWASDVCAMGLFLSRGSWIPGLALALMAANAAGGYAGAHVALSRGTAFVRGLFLVVVGGLMLRFGWQLLHG
jgi:uncharacterized membrane protein YfcA